MAQRVRRQLEARGGGDEPYVAVRRACGKPAAGATDEQRARAYGRDLLALFEPLVEDLPHPISDLTPMPDSGTSG